MKYDIFIGRDTEHLPDYLYWASVKISVVDDWQHTVHSYTLWGAKRKIKKTIKKEYQSKSSFKEVDRYTVEL